MRAVYLAGPIAGCTDSEATGWRAEASALLAGFGIETLDPMRRDMRGKSFSHLDSYLLVRNDKMDIRNSGAVLANCWKPGWGTAMEIMYAHLIGVPVVSLTDPSNVSPWVREHSEYVAHSLERAIRVLRDLC